MFLISPQPCQDNRPDHISSRDFTRAMDPVFRVDSPSGSSHFALDILLKAHLLQEEHLAPMDDEMNGPQTTLPDHDLSTEHQEILPLGSYPDLTSSKLTQENR